MIIQVEGIRKTTHLAEEDYIARAVSSVAKILVNVSKKINTERDEVLISEIANCKSILENLLDNLTYEA